MELFVELLQVRVAIVERAKDLPPDMTEVRKTCIVMITCLMDVVKCDRGAR